MEKKCFDCASYLGVPLDEPSEFGICLNDEVIEPFVTDLMENLITDGCRSLLEQIKFVGDRPACRDFEEAEVIEIDDDSPLGRVLHRLKERGELTAENIEREVLSSLMQTSSDYQLEEIIGQLENMFSDQESLGVKREKHGTLSGAARQKPAKG